MIHSDLANLSRKMRALHVIGAREVYGQERSVFNLAFSMRRVGHEVGILCSPRLASFYEETGSRIFPAIYSNVGHSVGVAALKVLEARFDVVYFHGLSANIICALNPFVSSTYVMVAHGSEGELLSTCPSDLYSRFLRSCVRRTASRAAQIVVISRPLAESFSYYKRKLSFVYNGVDAESVKRAAAKSASPVTATIMRLRRQGKLCLVSPGRLSAEHKGQDKIIRAIEALVKKNIDCYLFITGTGQDLAKLQGLSQLLGVADRVVFLNYLPRNEQLAVVLSSDYVVTHLVDQRFGGISQVHLEAAVLAKPVITAAHPDLMAFRDDFFLVDSFVPEDLASLISYMSQHPDEVQERARHAQLIAETQFSWSEIAERYLELCRP